MTNSSQPLQGQLLNDLDALSKQLDNSLNADNLGSTPSQIKPMMTAKDIEAGIASVNLPKAFETTPLEEFTKALCDEASELAEIFLSANTTPNENADSATDDSSTDHDSTNYSAEEIDSVCIQLNNFCRSLLNQYATPTEIKP